MKGKMERLTERDEFGNADIIGVDSADLQLNLAFDEFNKATDALNKLAEYEDLEEQGKLLKLPCAVGDIVYRINKGAGTKLIAMRVEDVKIFQIGGILSMKIGCTENISGGELNYLVEDIGETVFLTKEDAETALKGLQTQRKGRYK